MPDERPEPKKPRTPPGKHRRRAYRTPGVVDFGPIGRVTASGSAGVLETFGGGGKIPSKRA